MFCELRDDLGRDLSEGHLCAGHPFFLHPFSMLLAVEENSVGCVDAMGVSGEGGHHFNAMIVVTLP